MVSKKRILIILMIIAVSFIALYVGHFLFKGDKPSQGIQKKEHEVKQEDIPQIEPVRHKHLSIEYKGNKQQVNILEVDLRDSRVEVKPVLSHDSVFGFEKLSSMALRSGAYAAVNGGFFYEFGQPVGMTVIDGKLITKSTGLFPIFIIKGRKASLQRLYTTLYIERGQKRIDVNNINTEGKGKQAILYTPAYGTDNRARTGNITITIENGIVKKIGQSKRETDIPRGGMLLTIYNPTDYDVDNLPLKIGDRVSIRCVPDLVTGAQAYECGSWVVRDGKVVIADRDPWIGVTTNYDPRTAIGLKDENTVILMTVDGRQPGYSTGLTGKELGEFLLSIGVKNAAMLDGGASTGMIVNNKIVNRPSFNRQERPLGGAIIVKYKK
ncbi:MAG: phosphodiester glycosidase family protein [Clostridia bacterium]|nr:phosphodiester glycosidase family protein [Clostridia bacterium]